MKDKQKQLLTEVMNEDAKDGLYHIGDTNKMVKHHIVDTNKMITAVEWFMEKIGEKQPNGMYVIDSLEDVANVFQQAKAMEKEQIITAHNHGEYFAADRDCLDDENGLDYYNETYNK